MISSTKDEKLLAALIASTTIREAAKTAKISESQVYAKLKNEEFRKRYDELRAAMLLHVTVSLQNHLQTAVATLAALCEDAETPPTVRVSAANAIIQNYVKLYDSEQMSRGKENGNKNPVNIIFDIP